MPEAIDSMDEYSLDVQIEREPTNTGIEPCTIPKYQAQCEARVAAKVFEKRTE